MELQPKHVHAPELTGDYWFNSPPVFLREFQGESVFLIDFWDYSSTNCLRALPYLSEWDRKYREFGLVVIGVHTPEFQFARKPEAVERAVKDIGLEYPVVMDNDARIWSHYGVRFWPTRILVDVDGYIRFVQNGEGGYQEFERALQQLLVEAGYRGQLPDLTPPLRDTDQPGAVSYRTSNELYMGYLRGTIGNPEGFGPESTLAYDDPGLYLPGRFYAAGKWMSGKDCVRFNGEPGDNGAVAFQYDATEVNAVLSSADGGRYEVVIEQDGKPLSGKNAGLDVALLESGKSVLYIDSPKMYQLVRNREFEPHTLRLIARNAGIEIYTFSFVTSVIPEIIPSN